MLLHLGNSGGFGNCYLSVIHLLGASLEYGLNFKTEALYEFKSYFSTETPDNLSIFRSKSLLRRRIVRKSLKHLSFKIFLNGFGFSVFGDSLIENRLLKELSRKHYLGIYSGWMYRDFSLLRKHHKSIHRVLRFKRSKSPFIKELYPIGVHVRRGDFVNWENGKYFFSDEVYFEVLGQVLDFTRSRGYKPVVVPVSNEMLNWPARIAGAPVLYDGLKAAMQDLERLSHCRLIIGPPSTFARSASFIGNSSLFTIEDQSEGFNAVKLVKYLELEQQTIFEKNKFN